MRQLVVRLVVRAEVWAGVGGGCCCCCVRRLVMGIPLVAAGGGVCGQVRRQGAGAVGACGFLPVVSRCSGNQGEEARGAGGCGEDGTAEEGGGGGGLGVRVVQIGRLGVSPVLLAAVCVRRVGPAPPGSPWYRAARWLPGILGRTVVRRW